MLRAINRQARTCGKGVTCRSQALPRGTHTDSSGFVRQALECLRLLRCGPARTRLGAYITTGETAKRWRRKKADPRGVVELASTTINFSSAKGKNRIYTKKLRGGWARESRRAVGRPAWGAAALFIPFDDHQVLIFQAQKGRPARYFPHFGHRLVLGDDYQSYTQKRIKKDHIILIYGRGSPPDRARGWKPTEPGKTFNACRRRATWSKSMPAKPRLDFCRRSKPFRAF